MPCFQPQQLFSQHIYGLRSLFSLAFVGRSLKKAMKFAQSKTLDLVVNLAIILAAVVLVYFLAQKYFGTSGAQDAPVQRPPIVAGTVFSLTGVDWSQNEKTVLLVLQVNCKSCSDSMPFYKTLVEKAKEKNIKLLAVLPDARAEGVYYLNENGVDIQDVRQVRRDELKEISATPTLILIDREGKVLNSWIGKLPSEKETEVIANL